MMHHRPDAVHHLSPPDVRAAALDAAEHAPVYGLHDLRAAEHLGYLRGFAHGRAALDAEAGAQAAAFAGRVRALFAGAVPFAELAARRDGFDSARARAARARAARLAADVAATYRAQACGAVPEPVSA